MLDNAYIVLLLLSAVLALKSLSIDKENEKNKKSDHEGEITPSLCYEGEIYGII